MKLSDRHLKILVAMADQDWDYRFMSFDSISAESEVDRGHIRRDVRHLARKGLVEFARGLSNEDGELRGSGYGITRAGLEIIFASGGTKA